MNRKERQLLIEVFRTIRIEAEAGEQAAREIVAQDIGPTSSPRTKRIDHIAVRAKALAEIAANLAKALESHRGATAVLDRIKYPTARP